MNMNVLPSVIFIHNKEDAPVELTFAHGVESAHDLFMLCIDLFIKGIVIARSMTRQRESLQNKPRLQNDYSNNNDNGCVRIDIDSITSNELEFVIRKLANAGIIVVVSTRQASDVTEGGPNSALPLRGRVATLLKGDANSIESYSLMIANRDTHYRVSIKLQHAHKPPPGPVIHPWS